LNTLYLSEGKVCFEENLSSMPFALSVRVTLQSGKRGFPVSFYTLLYETVGSTGKQNYIEEPLNVVMHHRAFILMTMMSSFVFPRQLQKQLKTTEQ
jgi:hypothetical protein